MIFNLIHSEWGVGKNDNTLLKIIHCWYAWISILKLLFPVAQTLLPVAQPILLVAQPIFAGCATYIVHYENKAKLSRA